MALYNALTPTSYITRLNSLANSAAKVIAVLDMQQSARVFNIGALVDFQTNATGVSATGTVSFYGALSADNVKWEGGIAPATDQDESGKLDQLTPVHSAPADANSKSVSDQFDFTSLTQRGFRYIAILAFNESGAALNGSGAAHEYHFRDISA